MGEGHNEVARVLKGRLAEADVETHVVDVLELLPGNIGTLIKSGYRGALERTPWLYDAVYAAFLAPSRHGVSAAPLSRLAARPAASMLAELRPDVVVSTFHVAGMLASLLKSRGQLRVPSVVLVTEVVAHRMWLAPGNDRYLLAVPEAVPPDGRADLPLLATGPLVDRKFLAPPRERAQTRALLGIHDDRRMVLVVTGSWGVGDVVGTVESLARMPGIVPVALCGRNESLRRVLVERGWGRALGWVRDMPRMLAAADAVIENAGGQTAFEAFAVGAPVVSYRPIPGHGIAAANALQRAGLVVRPTCENGLQAAVDAVTRPGPVRDGLLSHGHGLFRADPADAVLEALRSELDGSHPAGVNSVASRSLG